MAFLMKKTLESVAVEDSDACCEVHGCITAPPAAQKMRIMLEVFGLRDMDYYIFVEVRDSECECGETVATASYCTPVRPEGCDCKTEIPLEIMVPLTGCQSCEDMVVDVCIQYVGCSCR